MPMSKSSNKAAASRLGGAEHRERAYIAASRRTDRSPDARLVSAYKASQAHFERTGRYLKISMDIVLNEEMYREEEEERPLRRSLADSAVLEFQADSNRRFSEVFGAYMSSCRQARPDDQETLEERERRINEQFNQAFPWHKQKYMLGQPSSGQHGGEDAPSPTSPVPHMHGRMGSFSPIEQPLMTSTYSPAGGVAMPIPIAPATEKALVDLAGSSSSPSSSSARTPPTPGLSSTSHTPDTSTSVSTPIMGFDGMSLPGAAADPNAFTTTTMGADALSATAAAGFSISGFPPTGMPAGDFSAFSMPMDFHAAQGVTGPLKSMNNPCLWTNSGASNAEFGLFDTNVTMSMDPASTGMTSYADGGLYIDPLDPTLGGLTTAAPDMDPLMATLAGQHAHQSPHLSNTTPPPAFAMDFVDAEPTYAFAAADVGAE